jgi:hypothetical protein
LLILSFVPVAWARAAEPQSEAAVKAAFLYRFTGFIEWPEQVLRAQEFTIAVIGSAVVAEELAKLLPRRPIKNLPARVRVVGSLAEATDAHMLYVGPDFVANLGDETAALAGRPVLIVTDHANGLDDGGILNFMVVDRRVRFEVSLAAAQRAGIKISSQLLAVAARVQNSQLLLQPHCSMLIDPIDVAFGCTHFVARQ